MPVRQSLQASQRIRHHDYRPGVLDGQPGQLVLGNNRRTCAVVESVGQKVVSVGLLAFQRDKERAGSGAARVSADAIDC